MKQYVSLAAAALVAACSPAVEAPATDTAPAETAQPPAPTEESPPAEAPIVAAQDALTTSGEPPVVYGDDWNVSYGWGGEYPGGFAVLEDGVTLPGRDAGHPSAVTNRTCPVDRLGMYHPWNQARNTALDLNYITATQTVDLTLTAPVTTLLQSASSDATRTLEAGTTITYLRYFGEGWGEIELDGVSYGVSLPDFQDATDWPDVETAIDEWIKLPCPRNDGSDYGDGYGFVRLEDALKVPGIADYYALMGGWGESTDLTEQQVEDYQAMVATLESVN